MRVKKAESLALEWMQRAQMDFDAAKHYPRIEKELRAHAQTRRNCAWELIRLLNQREEEQETADTFEKETRLIAGSCSQPDTTG